MQSILFQGFSVCLDFAVINPAHACGKGLAEAFMLD